jgi:3-phosphoshikimate 1-carboxyvinyltransferase
MIELVKPEKTISGSILLPGSKSISNRLLILKHIFGDLKIENLSDSEDTLLLKKALKLISSQKEGMINVQHAGTDMRFLTALLAVTEGSWTITGSSQLQQRPIAPLVNALRALGADIHYAEKDSFPPLKICGKKLEGDKITIEAGISSQFISALLLIAPTLENGLEITLDGSVVSEPYLKMTSEMLNWFGVRVQREGNVIKILGHIQGKSVNKLKVEADWSAASYYYSICALSPGTELSLIGLEQKSLQGDSVLPEIYSDLGVETTFNKEGVIISRKKTGLRKFEYDFTNCPDIAQTIAVTCFGLGIEARLTGLKTLKIKETDRIVALKKELEKFGARVRAGNDDLHLEPGTRNKKQETLTVESYSDHRMAMSFAPLAVIYDSLQIDDHEVVNKSYPRFWDHLLSLGFSVNLQP